MNKTFIEGACITKLDAIKFTHFAIVGAALRVVVGNYSANKTLHNSANQLYKDR